MLLSSQLSIVPIATSMPGVPVSAQTPVALVSSPLAITVFFLSVMLSSVRRSKPRPSVRTLIPMPPFHR